LQCLSISLNKLSQMLPIISLILIDLIGWNGYSINTLKTFGL